MLQDLEAEGVQIALASGRPPRSMDPVLDLVQLSHPWVLSCNGGMVLDPHGRQKILKSFPITGVYAILEKIKSALGDQVCLGVESGALFKCDEGYATQRGPENMNHHYQQIDRLEDFATDDVEKMVVLHKTWPAEKLYDYIQNQLFVDPEWRSVINITFSNVYFIEIAAANVSKGSTLQTLCAENDFAANQIVAFGDMPNDVEMIRFAGKWIRLWKCM